MLTCDARRSRHRMIPYLTILEQYMRTSCHAAGMLTAGWLLCTGIAGTALAGTHAHDWPTFGWNPERTSAPAVPMGITAGDLHSLKHQKVKMDGTVDSSAIYLHDVRVKCANHDVLFVTTTYGKTLAIDADSGAILWEFTPPDYSRFKGTYRIATATPVAAPGRKYIYTASPDGMVRELSIADGKVEWRTAITELPRREKIASALNYFNGHVIAVTGGYIGDEPPYQGHVAILDAKTGALLHIWNSLCSNRHELMDPTSCKQSGSAIWGRAGAVIDPETGDIFVATGNGRWNGSNDWGDSVIELNATATRILGNYTPPDTRQLDAHDLDLGSSSPALLGKGHVLQGGKDGYLRLLDWTSLKGVKPHRTRASSRVATPHGAKLFSAPAVWHDGSMTWIYVADYFGTAAWTFDGGKLHRQWHNAHPGTSPVVADGLVFVYDPDGWLRVYKVKSGDEIGKLACGKGHWNSPIVVDGLIALPQGNGNAHRTTGVLNIWRVR